MKIIIIGSGPGGYHTAEYAAKNGIEVTIIEENHVGGTCLNCGCIPTKTLCHEADIYETVTAFCGKHPETDIKAIMERKQQVIEQLRSGVETLMSAPGITLVKGHATIKDSHTVTVCCCDGDNGENCENKEFTADKIIIATGSHAKLPPIKGIDNKGVVTSTELLDIDHVPQRLCIIGAGVIGMEFASIFQSLGSEVTVVEFLKECLPALDSDIAKRLRKTMEKRGITFHMQSAVSEITATDNGLNVCCERKGKTLSIDADTVLIATGRAANTDGIGLENVGIEFNPKGIQTDENMQTSLNDVYAIGDVNGRMMLAHAASAQGVKCINHILGKKDDINLNIMPSAVFTTPEAGGVGLTEDACREKGIGFKASKAFYRANGKALAMNASEGMVKLLSDESGKIIGCHVYGAHAADIVQEATALMHFGGTLNDLHDIIHTHPTLGEILQDSGKAGL